MPSVLLIDAPRERADAWQRALEAAGYDVGAARPDLIVLAIPGRETDLFDVLATAVPVLGVVAPEGWELGMRAAIEGAARCIAEPAEPEVLVAAVDAVLGPEALPIAEQRRRSRQRALTLLARFEASGAASDDDDQPRSVHLTRLEQPHGPDTVSEPEGLAEARRVIGRLTGKQRALLETVAAEGNVAAAATRLETSRGNVYAGLRRIVHRLGVRDTSELLRFVINGDLLRAEEP